MSDNPIWQEILNEANDGPLDGGFYDRDLTPITFDDWMRLFEDLSYQQIAHTVTRDGTTVSTVWLGLSRPRRGVNGEPRWIFESMVTTTADAPADFRRYHTEAEALAGHAALVADHGGAAS